MKDFAEKVDQIKAEAKDFTRKYRGYDKFEGFTESEIEHGVAAYLIQIDEMLSAREEGRTQIVNEDLFDMLEAAGLTAGRAMEIPVILAGILRNPSRQGMCDRTPS